MEYVLVRVGGCSEQGLTITQGCIDLSLLNSCGIPLADGELPLQEALQPCRVRYDALIVTLLVWCKVQSGEGQCRGRALRQQRGLLRQCVHAVMESYVAN